MEIAAIATKAFMVEKDRLDFEFTLYTLNLLFTPPA